MPVENTKLVTAAQKQQVMTKLLASKEGRQRIAASVQEPLRKMRDYVSIGRKFFMIDELPDGALPIYDKDIDSNGYIVAEEGDSIQQVIHSDRIMVPLFEVAANPTIPFTQVKERRFDIVRRIKQKTQTEVFRKEDNYIFSLATAAATNNTSNPIINVAEANFGMDDLADAYALVEAHDLRVDKIAMNPKRFKVFRTMGRDYMDAEIQASILKTGFMGMLWGAEIYMSREIPEDTILVCGEPEYFGVMPIRIDLTVIPADLPRERQYGWSIFECIGATMHNDLAVAAVKIS